MKKRKYVKLKGENTMMALIVFFVICTLFVNFIGQAMLQSNMKINELSSLDNELEVANAFGLKYNNSNIRVVSK